MGFNCPVRKDIPSFLLEITTQAGEHSSIGCVMDAAAAAQF
jgi:hypothetical protein